MPIGYGGPHAAFFATRDEFKRQMPGRIIGVSKDANGKPALRMALGTREQHIRREKATSNICTAQVLLAVMAGFYAAWHGPEGLARIAERVHQLAAAFAAGARKLGHTVLADEFFDTVHVRPEATIASRDPQGGRGAQRINLRYRSTTARSGVVVRRDDHRRGPRGPAGRVQRRRGSGVRRAKRCRRRGADSTRRFARTSAFLTHPVFSAYHSETEMMRYMRKLESRDLSLTHSMIPLGSCTMKLNAAAEMFPVTWPEMGGMHPFAPAAQAKGYRALFDRLEGALAEITGFSAVSLQPNAGSQGEYTGPARDPRVPRVARRRPPQRLPDPAVGARHESGERGHGRLRSGRGEDRRQRQHRRRRPEGQAPSSTPRNWRRSW